jgi:uncharacterized protein with FMN-binding domain
MMAEKESHTLRNVLIVAGVIVLVLAIVLGGFMIWITSGLSKYRHMTIQSVDFSTVQDGTYTGNFDGGRWTNTVRVTVKDHKITDIKIVKDVTFPSHAKAEELFRRVEAAQSLKIDTITGATVTGKAYLQAIANALLKAP